MGYCKSSELYDKLLHVRFVPNPSCSELYICIWFCALAAQLCCKTNIIDMIPHASVFPAMHDCTVHDDVGA